MLISVDVQSEELVELAFVNKIFEACTVKLTIDSKEYIVVGIYRAPESSVVDFTANFPLLITRKLTVGCSTLIVGDFNIYLGKPVYPASIADFVNEIRVSHFLPLITIPTRVTSRSATVIDHIWCNFAVQFKASAIISSITDHYPVFSVFPNVFKQSVRSNKIQYRIHSASNVLLFQSEERKIFSDFVVGWRHDIKVMCSKFF